MPFEQYVHSLPVHKIPEKYKWRYTEGLSVEEIGFPWVCDCIHKRYSHDLGGRFPPDFDAAFLYRLFKGFCTHKVVYKFIDVDPQTMILAQRYIGKGKLLSIAKKSNPEPVSLSQYGNYYLSHDGTHRTCLKYIKGSKLYARVKVYALDF